MQTKDKTQKTLEGFNDIFADIVNVLLFDGKQVVKEDELEDATPVSIYKADGEVHQQERDVAKFWKHGEIRISCFGLENQSAVDTTMPIRIMSYDGAVYRQQITKLDEEKRRAKKENREVLPSGFYPVITMVLYFGERRWSENRNLLSCLTVREDLKPFVSDYKINVAEICYLSRQQVDMFKSDFRIVADYFYQIHNNKDYICPKDTLKHVAEVLDLLKAFTSDNRFSPLVSANSNPPEVKMEEWLTRRENIVKLEAYKDVALNFLRYGISLKDVAKNTNLPLEVVLQLAQENNIQIKENADA